MDWAPIVELAKALGTPISAVLVSVVGVISIVVNKRTSAAVKTAKDEAALACTDCAAAVLRIEKLEVELEVVSDRMAAYAVKALNNYISAAGTVVIRCSIVGPLL